MSGGANRAPKKEKAGFTLESANRPVQMRLTGCLVRSLSHSAREAANLSGIIGCDGTFEDVFSPLSRSPWVVTLLNPASVHPPQPRSISYA